MNILIIGNGGREYAIGLALLKDTSQNHLFFAPGNGATSSLGENITLADFESLAMFAKERAIDLTIVGPEAPLTEGIVDAFHAHGLTIFGPSKAAARLEGSKIFMKEFLAANAIPTAAFLQTDSYEKASDFIDTLSAPMVVKADGLCAGKGVIIAQNKDEAKAAVRDMLSGESFGSAGMRVVVEEFLDGYELSLFAICDGDEYILLPAAQDHKRLKDDDQGPNTGGMGAYAPTPLVNVGIYEAVKKRVVEPTLKGMKEIDAPFCGVLFIGLMIVKGEIFVLEYNVRFGDPECEVLMPLLKTSATDLFYKAATKDLKSLHVDFHDQVAVGVVVASKHYPYKTSPSVPISIDAVEIEGAHVAYAGVSGSFEEGLHVNGGRVLLCIGVGKDVKEAQKRAYALCEHVHFEGMQYRKDIAYQALNQ
ncbi:MAG: phosphoribosylamine--glycine ligase [Campylobacterales bacterium]|nr:phosphoribosylamine--glycine ligase [Campylobacterales bacterium]